MKRWISAGLLTLLAGAACSDTEELREPSGPGTQAIFSNPAPATELPVARTAKAVLQVARRLTAPDPRWSRVLATRSLFTPGEQGFETRRARADETTVRLPASIRSAIEFRAGRLTRPLVRLWEVGLPDGQAELVDGHAVRSAPHVDVIWSAQDDQLEQSLLLHDSAAPHRFAWRLAFRHDIAGVRREAGGGLGFEDAAGELVLRVPAALALGADGRQVRVAATFQTENSNPLTGRLELEVSRQGRYPVLVDPTLATATWEQKQQATPTPSARVGHAMAYDPVRKRVVLFGGSDASGRRNDTWEWDGKTWTQKFPSGGSLPAARDFHATSYFDDGQQSGVLLFGGSISDSTAAADTWLFDGTSWKELKPLPQSPPARDGHAMAYVASLKQTLLFGGFTTGGVEDNDTWLFDGKTWVPKGDGPLSARADHAMVYAPKSGSVLLFGGADYPAFAFDDTWRWSATSQVWGQPGVTGLSPAKRSQHVMAFDTRLDLAVLFGGAAPDPSGFGTIYLEDTREWDGTTWHNCPPQANVAACSGCSGRANAAAAYDEERDRVVLFGGETDATFFEGDTWLYRHFGGKCTTAADCEGGACVDGVCCTQASCGTCEACSPSDGNCTAVTNAADPDSCSGAQACDASGTCKKATGQTCNNSSECASGHCTDGLCCNQACSGACEACDRPGQEGTCGFVTGAARHGNCPGVGACGSTCDGQSAECTFTAKGMECGSVCQDAIVNRSQCDGAGNCLAVGPKACLKNLKCADAEQCRDTCSNDSHCAGGFQCDNGECVDPLGGSICSDEFTAKDPSGKETSCAPFKCAGGVCRESCSSSSDCADGFACKDFKCSPIRASGDSDDSGCGCRTAPPRRGSASALFIALAALAFARRRRAWSRRGRDAARR